MPSNSLRSVVHGTVIDQYFHSLEIDFFRLTLCLLLLRRIKSGAGGAGSVLRVSAEVTTHSTYNSHSTTRGGTTILSILQKLNLRLNTPIIILVNSQSLRSENRVFKSA